MDKLEPAPKSKQGNQFVVLTTVRYTRHNEATPTSKKYTTTVSRIFFKHWRSHCSNPSKILTNRGLQLGSSFLADAYSILGVKFVGTPEYEPDTTCQAELLTSTLISGLLNYVSESCQARTDTTYSSYTPIT